MRGPVVNLKAGTPPPSSPCSASAAAPVRWQGHPHPHPHPGPDPTSSTLRPSAPLPAPVPCEVSCNLAGRWISFWFLSSQSGCFQGDFIWLNLTAISFRWSPNQALLYTLCFRHIRFFLKCTLVSFLLLGCRLLVVAPQTRDLLCANLFYAQRFVSGQCPQGQFHHLDLLPRSEKFFSFIGPMGMPWEDEINPLPPTFWILLLAYPGRRKRLELGPRPRGQMPPAP